MEPVGGSGSVLIKLGGALLNDAGSLEAIWHDVARLQAEAAVIVVHGGGPQATELARRLQHEPRIVHGRRVTTGLDLDIIQWTIRGTLNTRLVAMAYRQGLRAAGISGADGATVQVHRRPPRVIDGETVDFGWVGDVDRVEPSLLHHLLSGGFLPVVAPLGIDAQGVVYNVNADTIAMNIAAALKLNRLFLVAEAGGVCREVGDPSTHLPVCNAGTFDRGVHEGWIAGGMRAKLEVAFATLQQGIPEVYILGPNDLLHPTRGTRVV